MYCSHNYYCIKKFENDPKYNDIVYISIKSQKILVQFKHGKFSDFLGRLPDNLEGLRIINIIFYRLSEDYYYLPNSLTFFDCAQNYSLSRLDFGRVLDISNYNLTTININDCSMGNLPDMPKKIKIIEMP